MIYPTVGRMVLFRPHLGLSGAKRDETDEEIAFVLGKPLPAIVTGVWGEDCVSVTVFDLNGAVHGRSSVYLWQGEGEAPTGRRYCEWMPYQKAVAAGEIPPVLHATPPSG